MKRYVVVLTMAIALLGGTSGIAAAAENERAAGTSPETVEVTKAPSAEIPNPKFVFDPVVEDTVITHDFLIKNTGDGPLAITKVKTG